MPSHRISKTLDLIILVLSLYVIAALLLQESIALDPETFMFLIYVDTLVCGIFLIEFLVRLQSAEDKKAFWKWGWIDLVSSIPLIGPLRYGRVIRLFRILRAVRATNNIAQFVCQSQAISALSLVGLSSVLMIVLGALTVLDVERDAQGANIISLADALWWSFVTTTTVGYGDYYPVTQEGRVIAGFLMTIGVGLFATLTGSIVSNFFLKDTEDTHKRELELLTAKIDLLHQEITQLREQTASENSKTKSLV